MPSRPLAAALLICALGLALSQATAQAVSDDPPSMRFEWVKEGPADVCGDRCREWIAATGPITADTARDFEFFTEVRDTRGATMLLDSGGGSVLASLELGRKVRALGIMTTVGRVTKLPSKPSDPQRVKVSPRGECASMCVFVLLGGAKRDVPSEARVLVHQIWPGGKRYDASAESYTAEEMVRIQRDVGRIARYTVEMGGDIELFELAMRIPPWERLRSLSAPELRRLRIMTGDVVAEAPTSGERASIRRASMPAVRVEERGWTVAGTAQSRALTRSHTLTIEGDEVGHFELTLACNAPGASDYRLEYRETRNARDLAERVKEVTLWVDGERMSLDVEASEQEQGGVLLSNANGSLTNAIVQKLRRDPTIALTVGTRTTGNQRTSIRLGATGFPQNFSKLAAGCRGEAHALAVVPSK